jgi:putative acyl-CoA dehydrogenase
MCLDVLRAFGKSPQDMLAALAAELEPAAGLDARFAAFAARLLDDLRAGRVDEFGARVLAERIVLAVQASLLLRFAPGYVAQPFVASRLVHGAGGAYGQLPAGTDCAAILGRALAA